MHWWKPGLYDPNGEVFSALAVHGLTHQVETLMDTYTWIRTLGYMGQASTDYYNDGGTGHAQAWGRNFCIGNGMMFHGKYGNHYVSQRNEGTFASIDGGMDAVGWGIIPYHAELDGRGQGPDEERSSSDSYKLVIFILIIIHGMLWIMINGSNMIQKLCLHFLSPYGDQNRGDDIRIVRVCDFSKGCRMKTQFVGYDVDTA